MCLIKILSLHPCFQSFSRGIGCPVNVQRGLLCLSITFKCSLATKLNFCISFGLFSLTLIKINTTFHTFPFLPSPVLPFSTGIAFLTVASTNSSSFSFFRFCPLHIRLMVLLRQVTDLFFLLQRRNTSRAFQQYSPQNALFVIFL